MKLSVIIPAYNEEKRIAETAATLTDFLPTVSNEFEIILVSDGSKDKTFEIIKDLAKSNENIKAFGYAQNKGKGGAVRTGMLHSTGDVVLFTDTDLAYGTEVIKKAVDKFNSTGADVVVGSRNLEQNSYQGYSFMRKLMSKTYLKLISLASGFKLSDSQCGFKCFTGSAAHDIFSECQIDSFAFDLEALLIAQKKGYKIAELPVKIINHDNTGTKVRIIKDTFKMLKDIREIKKHL